MVSDKDLEECKRKAKADLRRLARDFDLQYSTRNLNLILLSRREGLMRNYLSWAPHFNRFGKIAEERVGNIDEFFKSEEFRRWRWGGTVVTKKELDAELRMIPEIKNREIGERYLTLYRRFEGAIKSGDYLTLLLECRGKNRRHTILTRVLRHEWMHILLEENRIHFSDLGGDCWLVDEGLVTYMEAYLDGKRGRLNQRLSVTKNPWGRKYLQHALKWKNILEDEETPYRRYRVIRDRYKELKSSSCRQ